MTPLRDLGWRISAALSSTVLLVLLLSLGRGDHVPGLVLAFLLGLVALSALRPHAALLVVAALVPVATWLGRWWNPWVSWAEMVVVAFAAGYCARGLSRGPTTRNKLDGPLALSACVVAASLSVQFLVDGWRFGQEALWIQLSDLFRATYFLPSAAGDPVDSTMRLLESLLLVSAASTAAQRVPSFPVSFTRWFVGSAGAAAAINILRLWEGAQRLESPLPAFVHYLLSVRLNVHYADLNAAGSYFVMAIGPAAALAWRSNQRRWVAALLLIVTALWITGSRAAMVAGLLAAMLPVGRLIRRIGRRPLHGFAMAGTALALALLAAGVAFYVPERGNQRSWSTAVYVRWEFIRTSVRMLGSDPAFGVGIGRYYQRSAEFSSPELLRIFPPARKEHAHNNFLQLLAELGVTGFAAILWVLWTAGAGLMRSLRSDPDDPLRWGMIAGLLAFVLSWFGGHPLLTDEPAFAFWLLLGTAYGWGAEPLQHARPRYFAWAFGALTLLIALSVPVRAHRERADTALEHRGIGLSQWEDAIDGVRYRVAGVTSSVFVPSGAQIITVPLRAVTAGDTLNVELQLDGRRANVIAVPSDRWYYFRLMLPRAEERPRFHRLDLRVTGRSSGETNLFMIGKVEPR